MNRGFEKTLNEKLEVLTTKLQTVPLPHLLDACKSILAEYGPGKERDVSKLFLEAPMDGLQDLISLLTTYNAEQMLECCISDDPIVPDAPHSNAFEEVVDFKGLFTVFRFDYVKNVWDDTEDIADDYNTKMKPPSRALLKTLTDFDTLLQTALGLSTPDFDLAEAPVRRERGGRRKKMAHTSEGAGEVRTAIVGTSDIASTDKTRSRRGKPGPKPGFKRRRKPGKETAPPPPVDGSSELTLAGDNGEDTKPATGRAANRAGARRGRTKDGSTGRRLSASSRAKWMSREGTKMERGNVQPNDLLRCLLAELRSSGLVVKSIESKLAIIQNTPELTVAAPLLPIAQVYHMASTAAKTAVPAVSLEGHESAAESIPGQGRSDDKNTVETTTAALCAGSSLERDDVVVGKIATSREEAIPCGRSESTSTSQAVASIVRYRAKSQKNFTRIAENMDEFLRKPLGRLASSVITECMAHLHDAQEVFDNTWRDLCAQNTERCHKGWVGSAAERLALGGVNLDAVTPPVTLQDVPVSADLIVNPFSSSNKDAWNFLTSLDGYGSKEELYRRYFGAEDPPTSALHALSRMKGQLDHLFMHQDALYFRAAPVEDCLTPSLLRILSEQMVSMVRPAQDSLSNDVPESPRQMRKRSVSEMSSFSAAEEQSPLKVARTVKLESSPQRPPIPCGPSLQFCVDRTLATLQLGHNAIIVDKTTYVDDAGVSQPHSWHRARIVSLITRSCLGETSIDGVSKVKGRSKKVGITSRWGPILVVVKVKDLFKWEEVFNDEYILPVAAENGIGSQVRLMTYYGSDEDRALLRSYLTASSLYTQRSHCHVVLTHYETLATDLVHLKALHWQLMVLDSAWSIMSHSTYKHYMHELMGMTCRHRILSCPQLGFYKASADKTAEEPKAVSLLRTFLPDPLAALRFVFPTMWDFVESLLGKEGASDGLTDRLITHVLSALTSVCDESLSTIIRDGCNEEDIKLYYDITENLPWLEWEGVGYVVRPTQGNESASDNAVSRFYLLFDIDYTVQTTVAYADEEMARELKSVKMETIGKAANTQRRRYRNRSKPAGTVLSVSCGENGETKEKKRPGRKRGWAVAAAAAASAAKMKEELDRLEELEGDGEEGEDVGNGGDLKRPTGDGSEGGGDGQDENTSDDADVKVTAGDGEAVNDDMEVVKEEGGPMEPNADSLHGGFLGSVLRVVAAGSSRGDHHKNVDEGEESGDDEKEGKTGGESLATMSLASTVDVEISGEKDVDNSANAPNKPEGGRGSIGAACANRFPKPISIKKYDEEDEKKRSICQRGGQWQVSVAFPGRLRFLGSFPSENSAMQAYHAALVQRSVFQEQGLTHLPRMKFVGDKHGAYSVGGTGAGKKRRSKETATEEQLIARMTDDNLMDSVRDMLHPILAAGLDVGDWASPDSRPPAFAKLCGPEGFTSYITTPSCVLGRMMTATVSMACSLGLEDPIGLPGSAGEADIHLGDDPSVARSHARIVYNCTKRCFEIRCLHPSGIFVGGVKFLPESEAIPLTSWTVIQIGCRIFYFILPSKDSPIGRNVPAEFVRILMEELAASLRVRRLGFGIDGAYLPYSIQADDDPSAGGIETETLLVDMASLQQVVLKLVKPPPPASKRTAREREDEQGPSKTTIKPASPTSGLAEDDTGHDLHKGIDAEPYRDRFSTVSTSSHAAAAVSPAPGLDDRLRASVHACGDDLEDGRNKSPYRNIIRPVNDTHSGQRPSNQPVVSLDPCDYHQPQPNMRQWVTQQGSVYAELPASMTPAVDASRSIRTPSMSMNDGHGHLGAGGAGEHAWLPESLGAHDAMFPFQTSPVGFQVQQIPHVPQWHRQQHGPSGAGLSRPGYHIPNTTLPEREVSAPRVQEPEKD